MKKILIFYGSYGGGHLSASRSIKEHIENNYSDAEVIMVDCVEYISKIINKITTKAYVDMGRNAKWMWGKIYYATEKGATLKISSGAQKALSLKLNKLFKTFMPDLIISTHPFSSQMCAYLKSKGKINCKLATIMTDYAVHKQWFMFPEYVDYIFVAHSGMKQELIRNGIPESKVYATGIPLSNRFLLNYNKEQILQKLNLSSDKRTILFFAGGEYGFGKDNTFNILKTIINSFPNMQVVAIAGKNKKMQNSFEELVEETNSSENVKVLAYTNKVPELMSISDLVITKPGGLTTTESLASGLPIIVINPIPGQETENAEFLEKNEVGIWLKRKDNIEEKLYDVFNNPNQLRKMKINARLLAKRNSTADICKILLES